MGAAAYLILRRLAPGEDPSPEDAALASLMAFWMQDSWSLREMFKSLLAGLKG